MTHLTQAELMAYIHQTLTDARRQALDRHLAACGDCRARLAEHEQTQRRIRHSLAANLRAVALPATLNYAAIAPALKRTGRRSAPIRWLSPLVGTAILVLLVIGLVTLFAGFGRPQPPTAGPTSAPNLNLPPTVGPTLIATAVVISATARTIITPTSILADHGIYIDPRTAPAVGLHHLAELGFDWVKFDMDWETVEPAAGEYDWAAWDALIDGYHQGGVNILLMVARAPAWARPSDDDRQVAGLPADPQTYAAFVGLVAERYQGKIQAIEVWQDQNLYYMVGGQGRVNVTDYMALLGAAYPAIKAADPQITVLSGGLVPTGVAEPVGLDDVLYLNRMVEQGLTGTVDAIGVHLPGYANSPDARWPQDSQPNRGFADHRSFFFMSTLEAYRQVMDEFGDEQTQLWPTYFGWPVYRFVSDPRAFTFAQENSLAEQADYTRRAFEIGQARAWVGPMFLFNLDYAVTQPDSDPANFSILTADGPSPTYLILPPQRATTGQTVTLRLRPEATITAPATPGE